MFYINSVSTKMEGENKFCVVISRSNVFSFQLNTHKTGCKILSKSWLYCFISTYVFLNDSIICLLHCIFFLLYVFIIVLPQNFILTYNIFGSITFSALFKNFWLTHLCVSPPKCKYPESSNHHLLDNEKVLLDTQCILTE